MEHEKIYQVMCGECGKVSGTDEKLMLDAFPVNMALKNIVDTARSAVVIEEPKRPKITSLNIISIPKVNS
jgi:hypothetical protein